MAVRKKAVFFTYIAIILSAVIVLSFVVYSGYRLRNKMFVIETRVTTINDFIQDVEKDLERGLYIASFRSILSLEQYITNTGMFIDDVDAGFKEALLNGTVNNTEIDVMTGATFPEWADKIKEEADKIGIVIELNIANLTVNQSSPWLVDVNLGISIDVTDKKNTASWHKDKSVSTRIAIEGFEDPLYTIHSYGRVTNIIEESNASFGYTDELIGHLNNSYYIASATGPSFLMRLKGNFSASSMGIESLINLQEFINQGIAVDSNSVVDYIYFKGDHVDNCVINETSIYPAYSWFRLDYPHLNAYKAHCAS